jgi:hypothetical protein
MSVRVVSPADGSGSVAVTWDGEPQALQAGQLVDVPPGSVLEQAIGLANLTDLSGPELDSCQAGSAGAVSN